MSDRFFGSQYGKHSTYYGMNSSSLYGSNFSSVFADAPPPLEDFHEEDDDMVFRNSGKSSRETEKGTSVEASVETPDSSPEKMFKWASNGERGANDGDEFGDFSGFADFKSAFSDPGCDVHDKKEWFGGSNEGTKLGGTGTDTREPWPSASNSKTDKKNDNKEIKSQPTCLNNNAFNNVDDGSNDDDFADFEGFHSAEEQKEDFDSVSTSCNSENDNKCPSSPLTHVTGTKSNTGLHAEFIQVTKQNGDLQNTEDSLDLSDEDLINTGVQRSDSKSQTERKSSLSDNHNKEVVQVPEYKHSKSKNQDLQQQNPTSSSSDDTDDFGSFMSMDSVATDKMSDTIAIDNSEHQSDRTKKNFLSDLEQRNKNDESLKSVQKDDDFGEFSAVDTIQSSALVSSSEDSAFSSEFGQFESKENKSSHSDNNEHQFLTNENDFASCQKNVKHDFTCSTSLQSCHSHSESAFSLNQTKEPVSVDNYSSSINEEVKDNEIDENNDFGDFSVFNTNAEAFGTDTGEKLHKRNDKDNLETNEEETSIDSSYNTTCMKNEKNIQEQVSSVYFSRESKSREEKFGEFELTSTDENSEKTKDTTQSTNNDFSNFATFESDNSNDPRTNNLTSEKCENNARTQQNVDLFKDSAKVGVKRNADRDKSNNETEYDEIGDFSSSGNDNFGSFAGFENEKRTINTNIPMVNDMHSLTTTTADKCVSDNENKIDDFADFTSVSESSDWAGFSQSNQNVVSDHKTFGEFGSTKTGMGAFSSSKNNSTSDSFASCKVKTERRDEVGNSYLQGRHDIQTKLEVPGAQFSAVEYKSEPDSVFKPGNKVLTGQAGKPLMAAFAHLGQLGCKGMKINPVGSRLSMSSVCNMWKELQSSEKNGSLRFQWLVCHSQHKQLLSLNVVPDNLPVTSLLTPGGEGQKNMLPFMTGPGFVSEPNSGPVMSFRSGVKDVDPSQDPFGAPPEVGLPDLSFGFSNSKFPDLKPANGSSGPMALDLDFLATPSTPDLTSKQEHRSIYDEDLLGLDMQFSLESRGQLKSLGTPSSLSPKLSAGKDSQKVFKFGNVTIPLEPQCAEQELSDKAKEIVTEIEDLSFMLSSVLMFPLKSR